MKQTRRWFGPADKVSIDKILQSGVQGVVSALHHILPGQVWRVAEIKLRQSQISVRSDGTPSGIAWDVVESLPISEAIKTQSGDWLAHIDACNESIRNLASCGLKTTCYNFMPTLDCARTNLRAKMQHGGFAMLFDLIDFAVFDLHILACSGAENNCPAHIQSEVSRRFALLDKTQTGQLVSNIVAGLPGASDNWTLGDVRSLLTSYKDIDANRLRANLIEFLEKVVPVAIE